jgi:ribonuclease J
MQITLHNSNQIGGCVVEIRSNNTRIVIDMGADLPSSEKSRKPELNIEGVTFGEKDCAAVFISHYHGDHIGRFEKVLPDIPVYMGELSHSIFLNLRKWLRDVNISRVKLFNTFRAAEKIRISDDMTVTPYFVDHSAYDAHMFLIEAECKRILHTGDFRSHGWTGKGLFKILDIIGSVDALIIEGTMLSRFGEKTYSEFDLYQDARRFMRENRNIFVLCSSTNFDSIASFYKAAQDNNRLFVCDCYQHSNLDIVAKGAKSDLYRFPKAKIYWDGRADCIDKMKAMGFCMLVRANGRFDNIVKMFPDSVFIYSMWEGYLKDGPTKNEKICDFIPKDQSGNLKYIQLHTGGHATKETLKEVCKRLRPKVIIPIHSENPDAFQDFGPDNVEIILKKSAITI